MIHPFRIRPQGNTLGGAGAGTCTGADGAAGEGGFAAGALAGAVGLRGLGPGLCGQPVLVRLLGLCEEPFELGLLCGQSERDASLFRRARSTCVRWLSSTRTALTYRSRIAWVWSPALAISSARRRRLHRVGDVEHPGESRRAALVEPHGGRLGHRVECFDPAAGARHRAVERTHLFVEQAHGFLRGEEAIADRVDRRAQRRRAACSRRVRCRCRSCRDSCCRNTAEQRDDRQRCQCTPDRAMN